MEPNATEEPDRGPRTAVAATGGLAVMVLTLAVLVGTGPSLAIVWDEGFTLLRLNRVRAWFEAVRDPGRFAAQWDPAQYRSSMADRVRPLLPYQIDSRTKLFSRPVMAWFWPFAREEPHGHPPLYALLALVGDLLAPRWEELARARLGSMIVFSATAGFLFAFLAQRRGLWAAMLGAGALVLSPQLFALAHYSHYDAPLTCGWLASVLAFAEATRPRADQDPRRSPRWGWVVTFGILAGATAGTKLTGWFLPLPLLIWTALHRDRRGLVTLAAAAPIATLTLYALTPPWWSNPVEGVVDFLRSNLTRGQTAPLPVLFLGTVYSTPNDSLPWYNTLVWTVVASPVGFLAFALMGLRAAVRHRNDGVLALAALNWLFLLFLRALPHTPGHDGVRQFLPAFGMLALVAGLRIVDRPRLWCRSLIAAALIEGAVSIGVMMPVPLSYFSPLAGGLPGAAALGFEPTYYWDTMTPEVLAWINTHTAPDRLIVLAGSPFSYHYLRRTGKLQRDAYPFSESHSWQWLLLQNRPGAMGATERGLVARYGTRRVIFTKLGVPLVWAFNEADVADIESYRPTAPEARHGTTP